MLKRMPSSAHGVTVCTAAWCQRARLKLLNNASILVWPDDHSLKMPTHLLCYGVVKTISSSATISLQKIQLSRTKRSLASTSTLAPLLPDLMGHVKLMRTELAPSPILMGFCLTLLLREQQWSTLMWKLTLKMLSDLPTKRRRRRRQKLQSHLLHQKLQQGRL